jgi:activating signal cointegrator complex subunit 1
MPSLLPWLQRVRLERRLPYAIDLRIVKVALYEPPATLTESGIEGVTFSFKWSLYPGHHLVRAAGLRDWLNLWSRRLPPVLFFPGWNRVHTWRLPASGNSVTRTA